MSTLVESPPVTSRRSTRWLLVALVVTAVNLRAPISGVSALLDPIRHGLGLSGTGASVLTTLPTACLAVFAFLGPALVRRLGEERLVVACMVVLLTGDLVRSMATATAVLTGTLLVSAAIGVVNGIVPGLIKRDFADRYVGVTALYSIVLTLGAAGASALAPRLGGPLHSSWQAPLAAVTIPVAVLGCAVWLPALRRRAAGGARPRIPAALWRDRVAWQVTAFFGFTGLSFFFVLGWLPTVCHDRGLSVATGGLILSVTALIQAVGSLGVPTLVRRLSDQRGLAVAVALVNAAGLVALTVAPVRVGAWVAAVLLGLAQGAGFGLSLTLIGLRSRDVASATALSGMAQGVGYLIAVAGPLGAGLLHAATGGWTATLGLLLLVGLGQLASGLGAGRDRQVLG